MQELNETAAQEVRPVMRSPRGISLAAEAATTPPHMGLFGEDVSIDVALSTSFNGAGDEGSRLSTSESEPLEPEDFPEDHKPNPGDTDWHYPPGGWRPNKDTATTSEGWLPENLDPDKPLNWLPGAGPPSPPGNLDYGGACGKYKPIEGWKLPGEWEDYGNWTQSTVQQPAAGGGLEEVPWSRGLAGTHTVSNGFVVSKNGGDLGGPSTQVDDFVARNARLMREELTQQKVDIVHTIWCAPCTYWTEVNGDRREVHYEVCKLVRSVQKSMRTLYRYYLVDFRPDGIVVRFSAFFINVQKPAGKWEESNRLIADWKEQLGKSLKEDDTVVNEPEVKWWGGDVRYGSK